MDEREFKRRITQAYNQPDWIERHRALTRVHVERLDDKCGRLSRSVNDLKAAVAAIWADDTGELEHATARLLESVRRLGEARSDLNGMRRRLAALGTLDERALREANRDVDGTCQWDETASVCGRPTVGGHPLVRRPYQRMAWPAPRHRGLRLVRGDIMSEPPADWEVDARRLNRIIIDHIHKVAEMEPERIHVAAKPFVRGSAHQADGFGWRAPTKTELAAILAAPQVDGAEDLPHMFLFPGDARADPQQLDCVYVIGLPELRFEIDGTGLYDIIRDHMRGTGRIPYVIA